MTIDNFYFFQPFTYNLILFITMATLAEKSQEQQYFKKLLGKQDVKKSKVENYLKLAETNYEQKIKAGKYEVKEASDIIDIKKNANLSKSQIQNMKYVKKSLEKNLKMIDSRIQQMTQPDKKSKKIDDDERLKFVSQMVKARKQLQKKRGKKLQQELSKQKQLQSKQCQQLAKKQEQSKKKRKQQILKRAQSLQMVRKNRKIQLQNQNKQLKSKLDQKILSDRLAQKFKQQQQSLLQQRKKKLAEIRSIHKPLTKSQFQLHLQKIDKLKSQRSRVVDKQDVSRYISNDSNKFYKSSWYKKTQQEKVTFEDEKKEEELEQVKQMKDKLKKYGEYVRHNFKPEIDLKKSKQLKQKNKSKVSQSAKTEDLRQLGLKYLQWSKQHTDPTKKSQQNEQQQNQKNKKAAKKINYLEQLKKNSKGQKNPQQQVDELKKNKNLSQIEKAQKILSLVESIQRKAKLREHKSKVNNLVVDQQLDNMYVEAIEMKLKMLEKE